MDLTFNFNSIFFLGQPLGENIDRFENVLVIF